MNGPWFSIHALRKSETISQEIDMWWDSLLRHVGPLSSIQTSWHPLPHPSICTHYPTPHLRNHSSPVNWNSKKMTPYPCLKFTSISPSLTIYKTNVLNGLSLRCLLRFSSHKRRISLYISTIIAVHIFFCVNSFWILKSQFSHSYHISIHPLILYHLQMSFYSSSNIHYCSLICL